MDPITVTRLSAPIEFSVLPHGVPLPARLRWSSLAPFELEVEFRQPNKHHSWLMSRTLVEEALAFGSAGDGDVQFTPEVLDPDYIRMTIKSPDGCACLRAPIVDLALFLDSTFAEIRDCDVPLVNDSEIEELTEAYSWLWGE